MAIRFSPGCGCCLGKCEEITLQWIPSSPYDRGDYTDDDRWRPFTEYLQGDQFWEESTDRNGETHKFLFTAPATMFSGGGWTLTEEARYSRGRGISYADGLQDFELLTNAVDEAYGFPLDQIRLHEALQQRRLYEGQGLVSRREIAKEEWIATWNVEVKSTEEYQNIAMESLDVLIKFMGSAEYDSAVDDYPTSGIVTVVSKAAPLERVNPPYPVECIPVCEASTEEVFDTNNPQCGTPPPYKPEWKIEHGWFEGAMETLDETWSKSDLIESMTNARSVQPNNAAVMGALDVGELEQVTGTSPLSLHDYRVLNQCFGAINGGAGFADGFENHAIQNAVAVVTSGGMVTQGGDSFEVAAGDIIQIVDFTKLDDRPFSDTVPFGTADVAEDGAFLHIPAAEITEDDRTCYLRFGAGKPNPSRLSAFDIDVTGHTVTGGKLAVYVEKFSDTDIQRTRDGEYYCEFGFNMCKIETPASIISPQCQPIPAYECNCRPLRGVFAPGLDLTDETNYDADWLERFDIRMEASGPTVGGGAGLPITTETIIIDESDGIEWLGPESATQPFVTAYNDCHAQTGQIAIGTTWQLRKVVSSTTFGRAIERYSFQHFSALIIEHGEVRLLDCIGKNQIAILGRSVVHSHGFTSFEFEDPDPFADDFGFLTEQDARAAMERAINISIQDAANAGNGYLCNLSGPRLNDSMTEGNMNVGVSIVQQRDLDGDGDIDIVNIDTAEVRIAASLTEWSLQPDTGCAHAVTLRYPASQSEIDAQRYDRHYKDLTRTDSVSFANKTTVVMTTGVQ